ncbi:MAG: SDR family NAD(P)-dependent oxidoreductase, partial [Pseudomonadota bacterium]
YGPRPSQLGAIDYSAWSDVLMVNTLGAVRTAESFLDHVRTSADGRIVALSSTMGSIANNNAGGEYIYRSSKAALNAAMKSMAIDLEPEGITVAMVHPGWVRTDMGGPTASISLEESAEGLYQTIENLSIADTGRFLDYQGQDLPW